MVDRTEQKLAKLKAQKKARKTVLYKATHWVDQMAVCSGEL